MQKLVLTVLFAAGAAAATPSFALTKADEIGQPGNPAMADRTFRVDAATRYLNVQRGETVNLHINDERVTWDFSGLRWVVDLHEIAVDARQVKVYVSEPNDD